MDIPRKTMLGMATQQSRTLAAGHRQEAEYNMMPLLINTIIINITIKEVRMSPTPTIWFRTGWCHHRSLLVDQGKRADRVELQEVIRRNHNICKTISLSILILIGTISRRMMMSRIILTKDMETWDSNRTSPVGMGKMLIHITSLRAGSRCQINITQIEWLQLVEALKLQVLLEEASNPMSLRETLNTSIRRQRPRPWLITINMTTLAKIPTKTGTQITITMKSRMWDHALMHLARNVAEDNQQHSRTEMKPSSTTQSTVEALPLTGTNRASMRRNPTSSWPVKCMESQITANIKRRKCMKTSTTRWLTPNQSIDWQMTKTAHLKRIKKAGTKFKIKLIRSIRSGCTEWIRMRLKGWRWSTRSKRRNLGSWRRKLSTTESSKSVSNAHLAQE